MKTTLKTILIVGNAPCADTPEVAELIRVNETVLRMNEFSKHQAKHISDRCDIWGVNKIKTYPRPKKPHKTWWTAKTARNDYQKNIENETERFDEVIALPTLERLFEITGGRNPTTGFMMIHMAMDLGYFPTVCGFDWFKTRQVHFWHMPEEEKYWHQPDVFKKWHNPEAEKAHLFWLESNGKIELVV